MRAGKIISKLSLVVLIYIFVGGITAQGQELMKPSEGKALVYFVRTNGTGALVNFKYFDGDKYLGKVNGLKYFVIECDPGNHVFWASSENRSFIEADLESGKTYIVAAKPMPGAFKSGVKLIPVNPEDEKMSNRVKKFIAKTKPFDLDSKDFSDEAESLDFFISNGLKKYQSDKDKGKVIPQLPASFSHN